jgi:restriction system protein
MNSRCGLVEVAYSSRGVPTYRLEIWHDELKKHRLIKGADQWIVERQAALQMAEWDERWGQLLTRQWERQTKESKKRSAAERTEFAQQELQRLQTLLHYALGTTDTFDWQRLKDTSPFPDPKPVAPTPPTHPAPQSLPVEPRLLDEQYQPKLGFLDKLLPSRRRFLTKVCRERFESNHREWQQRIEIITAKNTAAEQAYLTDLQAVQQRYHAALPAWEAKRRAFLETQQLHNEAITKQRQAYLAGSAEMIGEYGDFVLSNSYYPEYFPQEFELVYAPETKTILVEYVLPAPESLPTVKDVRYAQSRDELVEQHFSQAQMAKLYDDTIYQITLRTIYELFEADVINAVEAVVFNGRVTSINLSTGQEVTACILSLQVQRETFMALNLANVDPKACFKALKGVGSSKLYSLTAVPPIMPLHRDDGRFVSAYEVANTLNERLSGNL